MQDHSEKTALHEADVQIISRVDFAGQNVLCLGDDLDQTRLYALSHGAVRCMCAEEAMSSVAEAEDTLYSIVLLFADGAVTDRWRSPLQRLHGILADNAVVVVNAVRCRPDDRETSPVVRQGLLAACGYTNVTETCFYVRTDCMEAGFCKQSYMQRWTAAQRLGVPLLGDYADDRRFGEQDGPQQLREYHFKQGNMDGITLLVTDAYRKIAYSDGNIDTEATADLRKEIHDKEGIVIFDVGGFVGANALVYARLLGKTGRIVTFEPNPYNRNRIFLNLSHNPESAERITVEADALGNESAVTQMNMSECIDLGHSSTSRIDHAHATIRDDALPEGFSCHEVNVRTLDDYVSASGMRPDILKVDIEGAEYLLLQGAVSTLQTIRPLIYIEFHSEYCAMMCTQLLMQLGYSLIPLHEENDNRIMVKAYPDTRRKGNVLADSFKAVASLSETLMRTQKELSAQIKCGEKAQATLCAALAAVDRRDAALCDKEQQIAAKERDIAQLQTSLAEAKAKSLQDEEALAARDRGLESARIAALEQNERLAAMKRELDAAEQDTVRLGARLGEKEKALADAQAQHATLGEQMDAMLASRSWRITKPLRSIAGRLRK